jgi:hypothetical protein
VDIIDIIHIKLSTLVLMRVLCLSKILLYVIKKDSDNIHVYEY